MVKQPHRARKSPLLNLYTPARNVVHPGEKATIDLGVGLRFPRGVCGLLMLKPTAGHPGLHMQPRVIGNFQKYQALVAHVENNSRTTEFELRRGRAYFQLLPLPFYACEVEEHELVGDTDSDGDEGEADSLPGHDEQEHPQGDGLRSRRKKRPPPTLATNGGSRGNLQDEPQTSAQDPPTPAVDTQGAAAASQAPVSTDPDRVTSADVGTSTSEDATVADVAAMVVVPQVVAVKKEEEEDEQMLSLALLVSRETPEETLEKLRENVLLHSAAAAAAPAAALPAAATVAADAAPAALLADENVAASKETSQMETEVSGGIVGDGSSPILAPGRGQPRPPVRTRRHAEKRLRIDEVKEEEEEEETEEEEQLDDDAETEMEEDEDEDDEEEEEAEEEEEEDEEGEEEEEEEKTRSEKSKRRRPN